MVIIISFLETQKHFILFPKCSIGHHLAYESLSILGDLYSNLVFRVLQKSRVALPLCTTYDPSIHTRLRTASPYTITMT